MIIERRAVSVTLLLSVLAATSAVAAASSEAATEPAQLRGTWQVTVDPDANPRADPPPFESTLSFTGSGTVSETTSRAPGPAGLGSWKRTGAHTFALTVQKYRFRPDGSYDGKTVIAEEVKVRADGTYRGRATTSVLDATGSTVAAFTSQTVGTRLRP